jgi:hypothetical protein
MKKVIRFFEISITLKLEAKKIPEDLKLERWWIKNPGMVVQVETCLEQTESVHSSIDLKDDRST